MLVVVLGLGVVGLWVGGAIKEGVREGSTAGKPVGGKVVPSSDTLVVCCAPGTNKEIMVVIIMVVINHIYLFYVWYLLD